MTVHSDRFDPYSYTGANNVDIWYSYIGTLCSLLLFTGINWVTQSIGPPINLRGDVWRWRNTFISWIHADIVGLGVIYCLVLRQVILEDLILYCDYETYLLVSFSLGYFLYDMADHVLNRKHLSNWEVTLHHICVILVFCYNLQYRVNVAWTVLALMTEINSIFLHARKLMQLTQWPFDHWLYRFVLVLNLLTFIIFRLYAVAMCGYGIYLEWYRLTIIFRTIIITIMSVMYLINPVLLWRLMKNDLFRNLSSRKKKTELNGFGNHNDSNNYARKVK